jgi:hypothetical protein
VPVTGSDPPTPNEKLPPEPRKPLRIAVPLALLEVVAVSDPGPLRVKFEGMLIEKICPPSPATT